jgi:hypothetical protein
VLSAHIPYLVRSLILCLSAQRVTECKRLMNNKEVKQLVDVTPHWGEPRTSCVLWLALCNDYLCYVLLSD